MQPCLTTRITTSTNSASSRFSIEPEILRGVAAAEGIDADRDQRQTDTQHDRAGNDRRKEFAQRLEEKAKYRLKQAAENGRAHNRAIRNHTAAHSSRNAVEHADKARACTHDDRHLAADRADGKQRTSVTTPATNIAFCRTLTCRSANSPPAMPHAPMMMSSGVQVADEHRKNVRSPSGILRDKGIFASKSCAASIEIFSCIPTLLCVVL